MVVLCRAEDFFYRPPDVHSFPTGFYSHVVFMFVSLVPTFFDHPLPASPFALSIKSFIFKLFCQTFVVCVQDKHIIYH